MKTSFPLFAAAVVVLVAMTSHRPAHGAGSPGEAFTQGKAGVAFRYRFEYVDQDPFAEDANASTLRGRINFETDPWNGFSAFGEFDYLTDVIWDDYNAGAGNTPDKIQYPVVADPTGPDLNQAYLKWANGDGTTVKGGRQRIIFDNARFVGNVGWRQNEQTYDAAYLQHKAGGFDVQLAYLWQVDRIFGRDVPAGRHDMSTGLANLAREWESVGELTAYYYDIDNEDAAAFSTRTLGLRWTGSRAFSGSEVGYTLEYAHQDDAHDQPVDYSADYYRLDLSLKVGGITPYLGYESLGGDNTRAGASFKTPLATLHAFNGWADKFLATPAAGLDDLFFGFKGGFGAWKWNVLYHDFEAESGGQSFGDEIDGSLSRKFGEHYGLLFKAASFDGEPNTIYRDATKFWVQITADF